MEKIMEKIIAQQGDCILVEASVVPETAKRVPLVGQQVFVVLKGEGVNTHELRSASLTDDIEAYLDSDILYLKTIKDVPLVHEEHGTTIIGKNQTIKRRIEREFDYEEMEARNTQD